MLDSAPTSGPVASRYGGLIAAGEIEDDPAQREVVRRLDWLVEALAERKVNANLGFAARFFARRNKPPPIPGVYIYGPVGRGKTMLMDLFFEAAPVRAKRRAHFHEFMADVHDRVFALRAAMKRGDLKGSDPIPPLAASLAAEAQLLCFDEFAVNDIADAMILGRLFTALFDSGVVMVATSNVAPDDLYRDGLNRALFLPFIALLKERVDVLPLAARTDFRLEKLAGAPVYLTPLGPDSDRTFDESWRRLAGTAEQPVVLEVKGRELRVRRAAKGVARFTFAELCEAPLGAGDYLKIARSFHTVFIDGIPVFGPEKRSAAKRFINLVDILYDHRVKLVATAEARPEALYRGTAPVESFEFRRTASRLIEMQGEEYLANAHGGETVPHLGTAMG